MARIAQVASEALGVVAMVNATLPDDPAGLHQVWRLGKKKEPKPDELPSGGYVTCYDVNPAQLKDERSKMPASAKRMRLLFGHRDIASIIYPSSSPSPSAPESNESS